MRILLSTLNSQYVHSNLALRYLFTVSGAFHDRMVMREFTINNTEDYIYSEVLRGDYGLVCFSCYVWNIEQILSLTETIKKADPKIQILLGGPEATHQAQELMKKNRWIDMILSGEGEETFPQLLETLSEDKTSEDLEKVRGLLYRRDGKLYQNLPSRPVVFDQVPFPYGAVIGNPEGINYYESSRGCPFRCSYCLSSIEVGMRVLPLDRVKEDLSYFIYKNVKQVKFVDRTFNFDRQRSREIFRHLMDVDNGRTNFHFEICGELLDEETLDLLESARQNLFQFEIGMQSSNPETLDAVGRTGAYEQLAKAIARIKRAGNIHVHLDLIAGLPHEDGNRFRQSFNDAYRIKPDHLQLGFLKVLPGTPLFDQAKEYGYVVRRKAPYEVISNHVMSANVLVRLKMLEKVLDLYYNRGGFSTTIDRFLEDWEEDAFGFYEEFADFFHLKGHHHKSQAKENLYRIFHQYAQWKERTMPGILDAATRSLSYDMECFMNQDAVKKFMKKGWEIQG